jgi:histidine ammonia-lyase
MNELAMTVRSAPITLSGKPLSFSDIARIGARKARLVADEAALTRVAQARVVIEEAIANHQPVYGSTTGVGAMKDVEWSDDQLDTFNMGLVRAHHFGTGDAFSSEIVRTAMAIRVNMALTGRVGCTTDLVEAYLALLSADVVPVVRRTGSIGCADIGLMGQIGAVLTGAGEAMFDGRRQAAGDALSAAGLRPFRLAPRDSLASISTNAVGYAAAANAIRDAAGAVRVMLATASPRPGRSAPRAIRGRPSPMSALSAKPASAPGCTSTPWAGIGPTPLIFRIR